jgi:hypothetical protein
MTDALNATPAPLVTRAALQQRYAWGDPFIRDAMDHGEVLHG